MKKAYIAIICDICKKEIHGGIFSHIEKKHPELVPYMGEVWEELKKEGEYEKTLV